jgi:gliding motility-associated-like protein|tara:strand:- start:153 stop:683 length:531 start_codon:yes stop_codon:yes gene_type:complete
MKWWVFLLLPFSLLGQETYVNCGDLTPQNYQVNFDADKVYYWGISGGTIVYKNNNSITIQWPDSIGTYIIYAYTTRFGCEGDTSFYEVKIEDCPYLQLFIPNSFTPNGDNYNETFYIHGANKDEIKSLVIFDRWGEIVYENNSNIPWNGENCQIGVYSYSVRTHNQHFTGIVHLIR